MTLLQFVVMGMTGLSAIFWLLQLLAVRHTIKTMPILEKWEDKPVMSLPRVSVIIPACNEAQTLEEAMKLRLQDNWPNLELILVDDRSNDGTREIVQKIAARDKRVRAVYIDELPEGWLGKVHALHHGVKQATGDWFLFSDADVHIKPGTLYRVMAYCQSQRLDHLAVVPEFYRGRFFADTAISVFLKALVACARSWRVKDKDSSAFGGSGAFNLVRRTAFQRTGGFAWLKLEVVDDLALGQMVKSAGGCSDIINGRGWVGVQWYGTFKEVTAGLGRAMVAGIANFSLVKLILLSVLTFTLDMIPYVILIPMGIAFLPIAAAVIILVALITNLMVSQFLNRPLLPALFLPLGNILVFLITVKTAVMISLKGGITWRHTFYSIPALKKGRRLSF